MAEPLFARIQRLLSARTEDIVDRMEKADSAAVMRETIREVDRAMDEARADRDAATARRLTASRRRAALNRHLEQLTEKARFALAESRDDLAEAALARQVDLEAERDTLDRAEAEASEDEKRLDVAVAELRVRQAAMRDALTAFESARREAAAPGDPVADKQAARGRAVERAEATFDRALKGAALAGRAPVDVAAVSKVAELDAMQRRAEIAGRMAALRQGSRQ